MLNEFEKLQDEIKRTNRLLALLLVSGQNQGDAITSLNLAGLTPREIADILKTTPNTVSVTLSRMKKIK